VAHRARWRVWQRFMDPDRFIFLDETGAATNMTRRYGWGLRSKRVVDDAPHGHWRTTTFVAGLRSTGIVAPLVLDGPMTGEAFRTYVGQFLVPVLSPGDVVVLDNLAAHKVAGVRPAIEAAGASILHLPPYSPDLNPIEQAFAKLEHFPFTRVHGKCSIGLFSEQIHASGRCRPAAICSKGRPATSCSPDTRGPVDHYRRTPEHLQSRRMPPLPRQLRLCVRVN
jgi:transposase